MRKEFVAPGHSRQIAVDETTYELVKFIASRDDRLLKGVVRTAVVSAYGCPPGFKPTSAEPQGADDEVQ